MVSVGGTLLGGCIYHCYYYPTTTGDYTTRASLTTSSEGSSLTLALAKLGDSGSYKCELALGEDRPGVTHTVRVTGGGQVQAIW